jgi:molybdopterin converting factor small subunit
MVRLTLPAPLAALLPEDERRLAPGRRSLSLLSESWEDIVDELRRRCPALADRVLTDDGEVSAAFVLVVNDEVVPGRRSSFALGSGDEIFLIAAIAGGSNEPKRRRVTGAEPGQGAYRSRPRSQ